MKTRPIVPLGVAFVACAAWFAATRGIASAIRADDTPALQQSMPPADLVLRNGKIVTVDDEKPEAQALAVRGDTIAAVGSNQTGASSIRISA